MRGQITVFIILGLIIMLVAGVAFLVYDTVYNLDPEIEQNLIITNDIKPLQVYIENCMRQAVPESLNMIGAGGGTLDPVFYRWYDNQTYTYLCQYDGLCMHEPLFRQDIEREIEKWTIPIIKQCIDLSILERQSFTVTDGEMTMNATIGRDDVSIKLDYPLRLVKDDVDLTSRYYVTDIKVPLGRLFELAIDIINSENSKGYFDQVEYMKANDIIIEKHRPYPDIVYNLSSDGYVFQFAMQPGTGQYGCCYNQYDNVCYKNTRIDSCVRKGGIYDMFCECPGADSLPECTDCDSCGPRQHGESWCEYETIAGQGYDFVGTRHYVNYCTDGRIYYEDCTDYREDLCTEQVVNGMSKAMCRPNRWQDCSACETKECCENNQYRDCDWKEWLHTENKCVPYVPPGFKFWESTGAEVCHTSTEIKECVGFSCPNVWVDDAAINCYVQGDCGNYRNIAGVLTSGGYFNSDFSDQVRSYVYNDQTHALRGAEYSINLGLYNRERLKSFNQINVVSDSFTEIFNLINDYLERLMDISPSHFMNPFSDTKLTILDIAVCDVWRPPTISECDACTRFDHMCTEYRCRSLGADCIYSEESGIGECVRKSVNDTIPPEVMINVVGRGVTDVSEMYMGRPYTGKNVSEIAPYSTLTVVANTSEETLCKISYLPDIQYINNPSYIFGDTRYSDSHNMTIRVPRRLPVPVKIMELFNMTTLSELVELFKRPTEFLENLESKYGKYFRSVEKSTGFDLLGIVTPYKNKALELLNRISDTLPYYEQLFEHLFSSYEKGEYYFFLKCTDRAGNTNNQNFVKFTIDDQDNQPPVILGTEPQNNSIAGSDHVTLYMNEPSECRFNEHNIPYENMNESFECSGRSSLYHGSYPCVGRVEQTPVYIICKDKPGDMTSYPLNMIKSAQEKVNFENLEYVNITDGVISAPLNMLDDLVFETKNDNVKLQLYTSTIENCSYSINQSVTQMLCMNTRMFHLGSRVCKSDVILFNNSVTQTMNLRVESAEVNDPELESGALVIDFNDATVYLNATDANLELNMEGLFNCVNMSCITRENTTTCYKQVYTGNNYGFSCTEALPEGFQSFIQVNCRLPETDRNTNDPMMYIYHRIDPVNIENAGPTGDLDSTIPLLYAETNVPARCGYYQDLTLGTIAMTNVTGTRHEAPVLVDYGGHIYYITCRDDYGNANTKKVEFFLFE